MLHSIRHQLILLAAVPLAAAAVVACISLFEKYEELSRSQVMVPLTHIAEAAEGIIHELQVERGSSVGLVKSAFQPAFAEKIAAQRAKADEAIARFDERALVFEASSEKLRDEFVSLRRDLAGLSDIRNAVDAGQMAPKAIVKDYTHIINDLLILIGHSIESSPIETVTAEMLPFLTLVEAKESGGLERAIGSSVLYEAMNGEVSLDTYVAYITKFAAEQAYLHEFAILSSSSQLARLEDAMDAPAVRQIETWRKTLKGILADHDPQGIDPQVWFETATERLNLIRTVSTTFIKAAEAAAEDATASLRNDMLMIGASVLIASLATVVVVFFQLRAVTSVLSQVSGCIGRLSHGEIDVDIPHTKRPDEIGEIARSALVFRDNLKERRTLREAQDAENHERTERQSRVDGLIGRFRESVAARIEGMEANTAQMEINAKTLSGIADGTEARANESVAISEQASANVQTVAAAAEELSASIQEISRQVATTTDIVGQATEVSSQASVKIGSLAEAAQRIGNVVSLIQDIAEQTNLLALNATIEAARAGEMGKGFAVVAAEVKELASQTAKATEEIAQQISGIQGATGEAVEAIQMIEKTMGEVNQYAGAIAAAVEEQGSATTEISHNAQLASEGTSNAAQNLSEMKVAASDTNQSAGQVLEATLAVRNEGGALREEIDRFLGDVSAA